MKSKGYTLVEVLVSIAIFSLIVAGPTGLFVLSLRNQNRTLALGETIDNTSHAVEYMSRALRMARKDDGGCITSGYNYEHPGGVASTVRFLNYNGYCQQFSLDGNQILQKKSTDDSSANFGSGAYLTADDLEIDNFQFHLWGESQNDDKQPRVTIVFHIAKSATLPDINVQTTVSQRNLDVSY